MNSQKITLQSSVGNEEEEENLIEAEENESKFEEYHRHRKIAKESCDLGRKYLKDNDYMMASKEFSKAVMTFEFMLKNNLRMKDFKGEVTSMMKEIILPAYSNLSLCYLKLKNWGLVISMADQVLQSDANNVKNLYRRGIARKERKMYHEAVEDFEKVAHLDKEMKAECSLFIEECKELRKLVKKQEKKLASSFIGGYASEKPEPKLLDESSQMKTEGEKTGERTGEKTQGSLSAWQRGMQCVRQTCRKMLNRG